MLFDNISTFLCNLFLTKGRKFTFDELCWNYMIKLFAKLLLTVFKGALQTHLNKFQHNFYILVLSFNKMHFLLFSKFYTEMLVLSNKVIFYNKKKTVIKVKKVLTPCKFKRRISVGEKLQNPKLSLNIPFLSGLVIIHVNLLGFKKDSWSISAKLKKNPQKSKTFLKKTFPEWFSHKSSELIGFQKSVVINQRKLIFKIN